MPCGFRNLSDTGCPRFTSLGAEAVPTADPWTTIATSIIGAAGAVGGAYLQSRMAAQEFEAQQKVMAAQQSLEAAKFQAAQRAAAAQEAQLFQLRALAPKANGGIPSTVWYVGGGILAVGVLAYIFTRR